MHKIIFFPDKPEKNNLVFTSKFKIESGYPKLRYFFIWPHKGADQTVQMCRPVCAFVIRKKTVRVSRVKDQY